MRHSWQGSVVLLNVVLVASAIACRGSDAPRPDGGAAPADAAEVLPASVLQAICRHEPCGGDRPVVNVYRDAKGAVVKLYRLYGACFHSPGLYFDPKGALLDTIPEKAISVGSPEAQALQQRHEAQIGGLVLTDVLRCSDGRRLPPK